MGSSTTANSEKQELPLDGKAIDEILQGMIYAELAITDDKPGTLRKIGKANPWHIEALRTITGCSTRAHNSLSTILLEDMGGLFLDKELNISGVTRGGHFLDTQGYIAHDDDRVVLSFRCTTSAFDWLTNFNTTSSAWEIEADLAKGYSGFCSGFDDFICTGGFYKPRVHTGFYNNFLAALPDIKKYIEPLLKSSASRPRTLYVVGHSLGAGIATLAGNYFLMEHNWRISPHRLVVVTAGSPRACCNSMKPIFDEKLKLYGSEKCRFYRLVKGNDVVTSVPPKMFGFCHLVDPIKITDLGHIVLRTRDEDPDSSILATSCLPPNLENEDDSSSESSDYSAKKDKYDRMMARIPKTLRDHMPDLYLKPLMRSRGIESGDFFDGASTSNKRGTSIASQQQWTPRMFRAKRPAPAPVQPTYF